MKDFIKIIVIAVAGYVLILSGKLTKYLYAPIRDMEWVKDNLALVHHTVGNLFWLGLCLLFTFLLLRYFLKSEDKVLDALGLSNNIAKGIGIGIIFTLPMFVGYTIQAGFQSDIKGLDLLINAGYAGFFEELIYRAFFIGLLYRYTRLGFFPVVLLVSPIFGAGHLYQGDGFLNTLAVMLTTSFGSMFFAWLFIEYKWNLWVPITMHILMNLCWQIFDLHATDAAGNAMANTFRLVTILLAVFVTLVKIYKQSSALKGNLIWKKQM